MLDHLRELTLNGIKMTPLINAATNGDTDTVIKLLRDPKVRATIDQLASNGVTDVATLFRTDSVT